MTDPNNPYQGQTPYGNPPTPQTPYSTPPHAGHGHASQAYSNQPHAAHASHAAAQPQAKAKGGSGAKTFFLAFAGALLACALFFGASSLMGGSGADDGSTVTLGSQSASTIDVEGEDPTLAEAVAAKCLPSVAAIDVYAESSAQSYGYGYYGYGYGGNGSTGELVESSLGSGVVLSEDGYIITNYHVIEGGSAFKVTVGGETYDAELVGSDPSSDIAVIKAQNVSGLTPIEVGDSDSLIIGEWVMSIGSPFGLEQSVATGIVSATSRSQVLDSSESGMSGGTTIYPNMIQTDAAINPGNSGGALVDAEGKLIGINTLITSYSGNYSGVGFAIPVNYAVNLAEQIIEGKTPTHAQLGVSLTTINSQIAKRYGLSADAGAYVTAVSAGTGAAAAGIQEGDIITAFNGNPVESASDLMLDVRLQNPGDVVTITVNRGGEVLDLEVTLGSDADQGTVSQGSWLDSLRN